ncbi:MAG: hypothetical protein H6585_10295 [Flavobacteriales bacterium]|nr:hypothetical protein [Flavobacteriales bacterium]MCB9448721.1 hypothetical protein [Flavobacteriales bacterium]
MRHILPLVLICAIAGLSSCKKDKDDPDVTPGDSVEVYAGVYDATTFFHQVFSPPGTFTIQWDSVNLYGHATDSLDINGDGVIDLRFELSVLNNDSLHLLNGSTPNPYPYFYVEVADGWSVAAYQASYPTGLGHTSTATFASPLEYNDRIDTHSLWKDKTANPIKLWQLNPNNGMTPPFGDWYDAKGVAYLGLVKSGMGFGWLKIDVSDTNAPILLESAIAN